MVFSLMLFLMAAAIGFFQYIQGFFSATLSAILVCVAAVIAVGFHEQLAPFLFNMKAYDYAASISIIVIFAGTYILLRLLFDGAIPGNVRFPVLVDKIGAGVMGLICGIISTGIVAIAADALPFGTTIAYYSRLEISDKKGTYVGRNGQQVDVDMYDVVMGDSNDFDSLSRQGLWFRQDDAVMALFKKVSEGGSLAGDNSFLAVHPDYLDELYGQRLGLQIGAKLTAVNGDKSQAVSVNGLYTVSTTLPQLDSLPKILRQSDTPLPPTIPLDGQTQMILVVRTVFPDAKLIQDESDNLLRFSAGGVRLAAGNPQAGYKDYHPVATMDPSGMVAVAQHLDDFIVMEGGANRSIDWVFVVDKDHVLGGDPTKGPPYQLAPGTFIEVKRYADVDLSGKPVELGIPSNPDTKGPLRLVNVQQDLEAFRTKPTAAQTTPPVTVAPAAQAENTNTQTAAPVVTTPAAPVAAAGQELGTSGLTFTDISVSSKLPVPVDVKSAEDSGTVQLPSVGGGQFAKRKWISLTVTADTPVDGVKGSQDTAIGDLSVDAGQVLVQVHCTPPSAGTASQMWAWAKKLADLQVADGNGGLYKCVGAWATVQKGADQYVVVTFNNYDDQNRLRSFPQPKGGRPTDVWLAFSVPAGTTVMELRQGSTALAKDLNFKAQ